MSTKGISLYWEESMAKNTMCGRYTLFIDTIDERMLKMIEICNSEAKNDENIQLNPSGEVFPGDTAPVLMVANNQIKAVSMRWGFRKSDGHTIINARSEDIRKRALFRPLIDNFRCVMPAFGYYEWRKADRMKYFIRSDGPIYLAGLWRIEPDGSKRFVILTKAAEGGHIQVHHRMPVVIKTRSDVRHWLNSNSPYESFQSYLSEDLSLTPMGTEQLRMPLPTL